jgi:hypothetical protein
MIAKIRFIIKRLSNPRVRWRLKVAFSGMAGVIVIGLILVIVYNIGTFNVHSLNNANNTESSNIRQVLTMEIAQRIVSGALKEDSANPKTTVNKIINDNQNLSTVIIENDKIKKVAWIIDMQLFYTGDVLNNEGYNLTEGIYNHYIANNGNN